MPAPFRPELYSNKVILAPMVRAGRTPLRVQVLDYGADLVYTEEIVDQKLVSCKRVVNEAVGTIDYMNNDEVVLRIAPREADRLILQIGTNSGAGAAGVALKLGTDVAGIDVNMGCPKPFSIQGGMGAALLTQPEKVKEIVASLVQASQVPISCKIRCLDKREDTIALARLIESCGASALTVHGRHRHERNPDPCRVDEIREVAEALNIPVIANGESNSISAFNDMERFRASAATSSVMVARKALSNPSLFRKEGLLKMEEDICRFLELACEFDECYTITKYVVQRILGGQQEHDPRGRATVNAGSVSEICKAWSQEAVYDKWRAERQRKRCKRKLEVDTESGAHCIDVTFPLKRLKDNCGSVTPKCVVNAVCDERKMERPVYTTMMRNGDKRYISTVEVFGKKFTSRVGQPNKRMAEQVACLAALIGLELRHRLNGEWEEQ